MVVIDMVGDWKIDQKYYDVKNAKVEKQKKNKKIKNQIKKKVPHKVRCSSRLNLQRKKSSAIVVAKRDCWNPKAGLYPVPLDWAIYIKRKSYRVRKKKLIN